MSEINKLLSHEGLNLRTISDERLQIFLQEISFAAYIRVIEDDKLELWELEKIAPFYNKNHFKDTQQDKYWSVQNGDAYIRLGFDLGTTLYTYLTSRFYMSEKLDDFPFDSIKNINYDEFEKIFTKEFFGADLLINFINNLNKFIEQVPDSNGRTIVRDRKFDVYLYDIQTHVEQFWYRSNYIFSNEINTHLIRVNNWYVHEFFDAHDDEGEPYYVYKKVFDDETVEICILNYNLKYQSFQINGVNHWGSQIKYLDETVEERWYDNGVLHRENGPAVIVMNGENIIKQEDYLNGEYQFMTKYAGKL